jgi:putative pyrroloquinoline-quinone binding quinoprotein
VTPRSNRCIGLRRSYEGLAPGYRLWRVLIATAVALATVLVAGADPAAADAWARMDLRPVTQPAPVGGVFALYVAHDGGLSVVGLDPATGATRWTHPASTSDVPPGEPPRLVIGGGSVIFVAPDTHGLAQLVAVDARTGHELWSAGPGVFADTASVCVDDQTAVCISGVLASDTVEAGGLRFDLTTGRQRVTARVPGPGPREIGPGLYDVGARHPERLAATRGARVRWSRPLTRIFPLAGASTDFGWNFERLNRVRLFVGSVGTKPTSRDSRDIFHLAQNTTAGFRIADGKVIWRARGRYICGYLPCAGDDQAGYRAPRTEANVSVGLRAIGRGTWSFPRNDPDSTGSVSHDARVVLEGFAPASGRTLWRFAAGHNTGLITSRLNPSQVDAHTVLIRRAGGTLMVLNLATGERHPISSATLVWCRKTLTYRQTHGYEIANQAVHRYIGQQALAPCDATSHRLMTTPPQVPGFVADIGARIAETIAWSQADGVFAAPPA